MFKKIFWFLAFAATGMGLLVLSLFNANIKINQVILIVIGVLFFIGLTEHFREIQGRRK